MCCAMQSVIHGTANTLKWKKCNTHHCTNTSCTYYGKQEVWSLSCVCGCVCVWISSVDSLVISADWVPLGLVFRGCCFFNPCESLPSLLFSLQDCCLLLVLMHLTIHPQAMFLVIYYIYFFNQLLYSDT